MIFERFLRWRYSPRVSIDSRPAVCLIAMACTSILNVGCERQAAEVPCPVVPVSGVVTLDGQPLPQAKVLFVPLRLSDHCCTYLPHSFAITDEQGRYALHSEDGQVGAVVSRHRVWICTGQVAFPQGRGGATEPKPTTVAIAGQRELVPARYNKLTQLVMDVVGEGRADANFNLLTDDAEVEAD